jgi:hypothetical protein
MLGNHRKNLKSFEMYFTKEWLVWFTAVTLMFNNQLYGSNA